MILPFPRYHSNTILLHHTCTSIQHRTSAPHPATDTGRVPAGTLRCGTPHLHTVPQPHKSNPSPPSLPLHNIQHVQPPPQPTSNRPAKKCAWYHGPFTASPSLIHQFHIPFRLPAAGTRSSLPLHVASTTRLAKVLSPLIVKYPVLGTNP